MTSPVRKRRTYRKSPLDEDLILSWADAHFKRHGVWPKSRSGPVENERGESWNALQHTLLKGHRGLPGGSSLALLLRDRRGVSRQIDVPALSMEKILQWADEYYEKHGRFPVAASGAVESDPKETWNKVDKALRNGQRGFAGRSSLAKALYEHRGNRNLAGRAPLSPREISIGKL